MKYEWTDWITHVQGQELLPGMYGIFEFQGVSLNDGEPFTIEGAITPAMRGNPSWHETGLHGTHCKLLRYKLRSVADEATAERALELVN